MERVKTGITGLDEIMHGGIPAHQLLLVTGKAGTGKTVLCSQFMYHGALKYKQPGVYLTFEEPPQYIKENARTFGWDFSALEKKGIFSFIQYDPYRAEDILEIMESSIREIGAERVVIDSVSALGLHIRDQEELRRMIFNMSLTLRRLKCTSIMTSEIVQGRPGLSRYGVEEFVSDSLLVFYYDRIQSSFSRAAQIWKLRGSTHSEKLHPYEIGSHGITINQHEEALAEEISKR